MWTPTYSLARFPRKKRPADLVLEQAWRDKNKANPNAHIERARQYEASRFPRKVAGWSFFVSVGFALVAIPMRFGDHMIMLSTIFWIVSGFVFLTALVLWLAYDEWSSDRHSRSYDVLQQYLRQEWQLLRYFHWIKDFFAQAVKGDFKNGAEKLLVAEAFDVFELQRENAHTPPELWASAKQNAMEKFAELYNALSNFGFAEGGYDPYFAKAESLKTRPSFA